MRKLCEFISGGGLHPSKSHRVSIGVADIYSSWTPVRRKRQVELVRRWKSRSLLIFRKLARLILCYFPCYNDRKSDMYLSLRKIATFATLAIAGLAAVQANAALTLDVTTSTATDFDFTVSGDFSGYTPPTSLTDFLYIVPIDSSGNPVTTWIPFQQTGDRPDGAINGDTIGGWVFVEGDVRSDSYSFLAGDGFNVSFNGGPYDATAVMTSPYLHKKPDGSHTKSSGYRPFQPVLGQNSSARVS